MTFSLPLTDVIVPEQDVQAVLEVYRKGWLTMGPRTQGFEEGFAAAVGSTHAVAVSSGTAALHLALLAAGVGPGDEVLMPGMTFVAAAGAVRCCGAEPVLCDSLAPQDHNVDPVDVAARITPRSKAILATHWWGYPCDIGALEALCDEHGLVLIEDAAQAVLADLGDGRRAGSAGALGCFSFCSKKQLCVGEGGMVVTEDEALAARVRSLRSHAMTSVTWDRHRGHAESYDILDIGFNYRIDEPRAALGLARLPRLAGDLEKRRAMVHAYRSALAGVDGVLVPWSDEEIERSTHFVFGVVLDDQPTRDAVRAALAEQGIQTTAYPCISQLTEYSGGTRLAIAEDIADRHLALPLSSSFGEPEVKQVVAAVRGALS